MLTLKKFQRKCVEEIKHRLLIQNQYNTVIQAPTGSGKTIILSKFIDECLDETSDNLVFIWFTPGAGDLEDQSKKKFDTFINNRTTKYLDDVLNCGFAKDDVVFINWEQVTKNTNKAFNKAEQRCLLDKIEIAKENLKFIIIIDECHIGNTDKAKSIVSKFEPIAEISVSATIDKADIKIEEYEVIEEELITKAIYINDGIPKDIMIKNEHFYLIDKAIEKHSEIKKQYDLLNLNINPLIIIQYPNNSDYLIDEVNDYLKTKGFSYELKNVGIWMSGDSDSITKKENIDNITANNDSVSILHIKQAISTGWDCVRAKILVKLRVNMKDSFEVQTLGRIRRMPEQKHYQSELLDNCFLYTFDEDYKNEVVRTFNDAYNTKLIFLKTEYEDIDLGLVKEMKSSKKSGLAESETKDLIKKYLIDYLSLTNDTDLNKELLYNIGFDFNPYISKSIIQEKVYNSKELLEDAHKVSVNIEIDLKDKKLLNESIWIIASKLGFERSLTSGILKNLFLNEGDILSLSEEEFFAFIVNNRDLIKDLFFRAINSNITQEKVANTEITTMRFAIPKIDLFKFKTGLKTVNVMDSNVYVDYTDDAVRSKPEKRFERYCEVNENVEWLYKNGESSQSYLSIIRIDNTEKQWIFYPDYIIKLKNGDLYIIETKGGEDSLGNSKNIDSEKVEGKFNALKRYVSQHEDRYFKTYGTKCPYKLNWGFVRDSDIHENELYFNNTEYQEDLHHSNWINLKEVF